MLGECLIAALDITTMPFSAAPPASLLNCAHPRSISHRRGSCYPDSGLPAGCAASIPSASTSSSCLGPCGRRWPRWCGRGVRGLGSTSWRVQPPRATNRSSSRSASPNPRTSYADRSPSTLGDQRSTRRGAVMVADDQCETLRPDLYRAFARSERRSSPTRNRAGGERGRGSRAYRRDARNRRRENARSPRALLGSRDTRESSGGGDLVGPGRLGAVLPSARTAADHTLGAAKSAIVRVRFAKMRIVLGPVGTRGDVQPMIALARALVARGHHVIVWAAENFEPLVTQSGAMFARGGRDAQGLVEEPAIRSDRFGDCT